MRHYIYAFTATILKIIILLTVLIQAEESSILDGATVHTFNEHATYSPDP